MSLISILVLHSNSLKGLEGFVTFDANHTLTLSPQAKNLVTNATFLVLNTGAAGSDPDFITTELNALSVDGLVPYGVGIVLPRTKIPGMTEETRRAQDANLIESFHRECVSSTSAVNSSKVFGQPDARQSENRYLASMGEIANLIVPRACGALLPQDDILKAFETAARLVPATGTVKDNAHIHTVLFGIAGEQLELIMANVTAKRATADVVY
jgi:hypothetical protein